jgi:hypothetical protein
VNSCIPSSFEDISPLQYLLLACRRDGYHSIELEQLLVKKLITRKVNCQKKVVTSIVKYAYVLHNLAVEEEEEEEE